MVRVCCPSPSSSSGGVVCGGSAGVDVVGDVYDGMACCYPLEESGNGTPDEYTDKTRFNLDGTGGLGVDDPSLVPIQDEGVFCLYSQHLNGRQFIQLPQDTMQDCPFTVSCWARIETYHKPRSFYSRGFRSVDAGESWVFVFGHSVLNQLEARVNTLNTELETVEYIATASSRLTQDTWYHLACSYEPGAGLKLYVNGVLVGSTSVDAALVPLVNGGFIGRWNEASMPTGNIQELRVYGEVKTAAYLLAEYQNFCSSGFVTIGGELAA